MNSLTFPNDQAPIPTQKANMIRNSKKYLELKLNYKLFDRVISAYKVNGIQIEKKRTSHDKTYKDLLGKNWYVRVDFPFWIKEGETSSTDYDKFVFSFQRSI